MGWCQRLPRSSIEKTARRCYCANFTTLPDQISDSELEVLSSVFNTLQEMRNPGVIIGYRVKHHNHLEPELSIERQSCLPCWPFRTMFLRCVLRWKKMTNAPDERLRSTWRLSLLDLIHCNYLPSVSILPLGPSRRRKYCSYCHWNHVSCQPCSYLYNLQSPKLYLKV
jgi:hypothetical protein